MKKLLIFLFLAGQASAQQKLWTEADRQYTIDNFVRTRDELIRETETLKPEQWAFKESPEKWSIAEVVEHLALWEIIWAREISMGSRSIPQPELIRTSRPDSYYHEFIMEEKPHTAPGISAPTGFIKGKDNLTFYLDRHKDNLDFLKTTQADMRVLFEMAGTDYPRNMHQVYIFQWGHVDRHLRQIRRIKSQPKFPK